MAAKNAFYAQSGGVTAVINATACGLIQEARRHPEKIGKVYAGRDGIIGALTEDLIDTSLESDDGYRPPAPHAGRRLRFLSLQAEKPRAASGPIRAPDRSVQGARHRLLLLQRRQRFHGYRLEGVADRREDGLPGGLRRRAENGRQRPAAYRLLPGFRLGRQVCRDLDPRGRLRRCLDGAHLDQDFCPRSDGPPRRLDHRRLRPGFRERRRAAAHPALPGSAVRSRCVSWLASTSASSCTATVRSPFRKVCPTPTAS
jgi:hypothetical protein